MVFTLRVGSIYFMTLLARTTFPQMAEYWEFISLGLKQVIASFCRMRKDWRSKYSIAEWTLIITIDQPVPVCKRKTGKNTLRFLILPRKCGFSKEIIKNWVLKQYNKSVKIICCNFLTIGLTKKFFSFFASWWHQRSIWIGEIIIEGDDVLGIGRHYL